MAYAFLSLRNPLCGWFAVKTRALLAICGDDGMGTVSVRAVGGFNRLKLGLSLVFAVWAVSLAVAGVDGLERSNEQSQASLQQVEIPIAIRRLENNTKALAVPVTVGGQSLDLHLDTGSTGVRVLADEISPEFVQRTGERTQATFFDGTVFEGEIAIAPISIGPIPTTEPIAIHLVDTVRCPEENPECFAPYQQAGMSGVLGLSMGARTGGSALEIYSPISRLPDNFQSGYIVRTRGFYSVDGRLTLGLVPESLVGFQTMSLPPRHTEPTTFPDGSIVWQDDALSLNHSLKGDGIPPEFQDLTGRTLFDSGAAHVVLGVDRESSFAARLWPGAVLTSRLEDRLSWQLQAGNTPSLSQVFVRGVERSPQHILGLPFFFNYEVAFNRRDGAIGFKPIGTTPPSAIPHPQSLGLN
ncbi:MAG: hypothetical protein AB4050_09770 [Synechococcus sp.]